MVQLEFGALCAPIEKQLNAQGYTLLENDSKRLQDIADAIIILKIHRVIPDSVVLTSEQKLMKLIANVARAKRE
jgi:hypothetical protein